MALTQTPNNSYSFYTCGLCGISAQFLVEVVDENDVVIVDENLVPLLVNDEPTASAEMTEHMETEHPPKEDD